MSLSTKRERQNPEEGKEIEKHIAEESKRGKRTKREKKLNSSFTDNKVTHILRSITMPKFSVAVLSTLGCIVASVCICGCIFAYQLGVRWLIGLL